MGWTFPWVSSGGTDFSFDFDVSFRDEDVKAGTERRTTMQPKQGAMTDLPGISAFVKDQDGSTFHTYSYFRPRTRPMNPAYAYLDLTAFGRQEDGLPNPMSWVRLHDEYEGIDASA